MALEKIKNMFENYLDTVTFSCVIYFQIKIQQASRSLSEKLI